MFFSRIEGELREIKSTLANQDKTLAANTMSLQEHMRRTEVLERRLDSIWSKALMALSIIGGLLMLLKNVAELVR